MDILKVQFGRVPPELAAQVRSIQGAERLEALLRQAVVAETIEAFQQALAQS